MRRSYWLILIGIAAGLLLTAAVLTFNQPYTFRGSVVQTPFAAPDFTLPDGPQGTYHLAQQRGDLTLIFFGYTSCPDVCPSTLSQLKQIHQRLGADANRLQVVFITVDPDRDTPEKTARYAAAFDPSFIGLSGTEEQLAPTWKAYSVYRKLDKTSPTDQAYPVEHSTQMYLVDTHGNLRVTYTYGVAADDVLQDMRHLLKE